MTRSGTALFAVLAGLGASAAAEGDGKADPRQGAEVDRICFGRNINNFKTIDGVDDVILLEKGVNDWYRAKLLGACSYSQLRWAQAVAIEQHPAGGCVTDGDYLIFSRSAFGDFSFPNTTRCAITDIHEWNEDAAAEDADGAEKDPSPN